VSSEVQNGRAAAPTDRFGRVLHAGCRVVAAIGGTLLAAAGVMTVASVLGRYLFSAPIPGDFELVELSSALAVFSFLPWCQMVHGNVLVDFFTAGAPPRVRAALDGIGALALAAIGMLLVWRMSVGGLELKRIGEQTVLLQIPRYLAFYPILACLALLVLVSAYTCWTGLAVAARGGRSGR
jgi:TRAP-type C4-dicarboxylate transport system permease small subunit